MSEVGSVPSNYPYILSHILSRYDFKHVFEAVAADNPAGVMQNQARTELGNAGSYART